MEVPAAETTVDFTESYAVTSITPTSITVVIAEGTTASDQGDNFSYTVTINGENVPVTGTTNFETTWTFSATTLSLSFPSRQTAFVFTEVASFSN